MAGLRICVLLKTNSGGLWSLPPAEELRRRGHEVVFILPSGPGRLRGELGRRGFTVLDSPFIFRFRPNLATVQGLWKLRRLLQALKPDVLHYQLYISALAARLTGLGLPLARAHMVAGPLYLESRIVRSVERLLWRMDHVTICCTQHISRLYGQLGCPADRRPVAQYGTDLRHFTPPWAAAGASHGDGIWSEQRAKARADVGIAEDIFLVLMVAWVYPPKRLIFSGRDFKGHDILLEAWPAFHAQHPRSHLLLIGEGFSDEGKAYRQRLIQRFGVEDNPSVTWLGWVPDVRAYYNAADVNVTPSLSEGCNGVVREASAMGLPSVVSDAGGLPEAVDARTGWIVPRGNASALTAALASACQEHAAGRLSARANNARTRAVRSFDQGMAARELADLIEDATSRRHGR